MESLPITKPAGSKRVKVKASTNSSSGTPYCRPTEKLEALQWSKAGTHATAPSKAERRAEAKAKGYEGEMCSECGNFTLVRNGTCMKCDTCGSTTGCS